MATSRQQRNEVEASHCSFSPTTNASKAKALSSSNALDDDEAAVEQEVATGESRQMEGEGGDLTPRPDPQLEPEPGAFDALASVDEAAAVASAAELALAAEKAVLAREEVEVEQAVLAREEAEAVAVEAAAAKENS